VVPILTNKRTTHAPKGNRVFIIGLVVEPNEWLSAIHTTLLLFLDVELRCLGLQVALDAFEALSVTADLEFEQRA
jgi:hypothetical protein